MSGCRIIPITKPLTPPIAIKSRKGGFGTDMAPKAPFTRPVIAPVTISVTHSRWSNLILDEQTPSAGIGGSDEEAGATRAEEPCLSPWMTPPSAGENQAVRDAFAQWASLQPGAPRDPQALIEDVEGSLDHVGLLDTDLQGRRIVWKQASARARARVTSPAIVIGDVDPWEDEPASLHARSDHVALCEPCSGAGKTRCTACAGMGKVRCAACGGQRKMYGYAANGSRRLLNCTTCRGKGEVDCAHCRRGIAVCTPCAGEGRVQRWLELEWWRRSVSSLHPSTSRFEWGDHPSNDLIERDAEVVVDLDRPYSLGEPELHDIPAEWLAALAPKLMPGERVERQRLRIARVPIYTVHYRLGSDEDQVAFAGKRLFTSHQTAVGAFARRAARLRVLLLLSFTVWCVVTLASLARGPFFWSVATLLSLMALGVALVASYRAATEWTAARLRLRGWLLTAFSALAVSVILAIVALPRIAHADRLIAGGEWKRAESELRALRGRAGARSWADLWLARIRGATDIHVARGFLGQIPPGLPQAAEATGAVDQLILRQASDAARSQDWTTATTTLALLSPNARGKPESMAVAREVYVPIAQQKIAQANWPAAADTIVAAQVLNVFPAELEPLKDSIRKAGLDAAASAKRERAVRARLLKELAAEEILVSWERTSESWGTPPLMALRTAMARDVAAVERSQRRGTR